LIEPGHKFVARYARHSSQDTLVADSALAELGLDHVMT